MSFIDTRDISEVVARLMASDDLNGGDFDLTGPRALDHDEVAAILSKATGREITYQAIEPAMMKQGLLAAGLTEAYADFLLLILGFLAQGYNERTTTEVRSLIGREPGAFEHYANDHRQAWQIRDAA